MVPLNGKRHTDRAWGKDHTVFAYPTNEEAQPSIVNSEQCPGTPSGQTYPRILTRPACENLHTLPIILLQSASTNPPPPPKHPA